MFHLLTDIIQQDSNDQTREVSAEVNSPQEIDANINSVITYGKGSAIVKMLTYILGKETFRRGLTRYFKEFSYQNVNQFNLWNSLYEVFQIFLFSQNTKFKFNFVYDLKQAKSEGRLESYKSNASFMDTMKSWTKQRGHPVVHVEVLNSTHIKVKQNRFVLDSNTKQSDLRE